METVGVFRSGLNPGGPYQVRLIIQACHLNEKDNPLYAESLNVFCQLFRHYTRWLCNTLEIA